MIPVEGYTGLYRDENSGAIINRNISDYEDYIKTKNNILKEKVEIENIKKEIIEIKELLNLLVNKT
jgi:hypothetical protein